MKQTISIILAVRNEEKFIKQTIASLLSQNCDSFNLEVLAIDGMSTDNSLTILNNLAQNDDRVSVYLNEDVKTPFAFNIGIEKAKGKYIAILGAHTIYDDNYLEVCYKELLAKKAIGCSGRVICKSKINSSESQALLEVYLSKFGVSGSSFRTMKEGYADSIPYPIFIKDALKEIGGYNTSMHRNQDNDLNRRLISMGHKLFYTYKTTCTYYPKTRYNEMLSYAYKNGVWNSFSLRQSPGSMSLHHVIPSFFTLYILLLLPLSLISIITLSSIKFIAILFLPLFIYLGIACFITLSVFFKNDYSLYLKLPWYFFRFHTSYGIGTLKGIFMSSDTITKS